MIIALQLGRVLMVSWILYSLFQLFAPHILHQPPNDVFASLSAFAAKVTALADQGPLEIAQDDTFFRCDSGRLKLRAFPNGTGELIYYRRANHLGPKESFYLRSPTSAPDTLRESLSLAYGQVGRVRKHRILFLVGRTRVHIDKVEQLGHFLELEVGLADDEPADAGIREARELMGS